MSDPVPPPLPPMPYPGTLTEEQRARLAELWRQYWSYLYSLWYQPPPVPPGPPPPVPPPPPPPDTVWAGAGPDAMAAAPAAECHPAREWEVWQKVVTETHTITRARP